MRFLKLLLLIIFMFSVVGCSPAKESAPLIVDNVKPSNTNGQSGTAAKKNVALVMKTLTNPFFIEMERGARKAEKELNINLIVKTGAKETSIDQQIAIVEELILAKVDAIVIAPASSTELIPALKKAQEAKIPIINIDNQLDPEVSRKIGLIDVPFISVNNEQGAYLSAKYISEKITSPVNVAVLEGIRSAQNAQDRKNGALRAFSENGNIKVVAMETANWKIDEAYTVTADLYKRHPDIAAFFCANDMMALGTLKYLSDAGKNNVLVAAYDALEEAKTVIRSNKLAVTIDQQADLQGYLGVKYAWQKLNGENVPPETLVDVRVIHSNSL